MKKIIINVAHRVYNGALFCGDCPAIDYNKDSQTVTISDPTKLEKVALL